MIMRTPYPVIKRPSGPLSQIIFYLENSTIEVLVRLVEDFEMPTSLLGQGIHSPLTGNKRCVGQEAHRDGWE
jgi:hypothetical protein